MPMLTSYQISKRAKLTREYWNDRRRRRRQRFIKLLGGRCARCGSTEDLQFDHINPAEKEFRIADRLDAPEDVLLKEVRKCRLLCAKCHREKTREMAEHGQPKARHGTLWMYKHYGCRCDKCKQRMSEYNKERRMLLKAITSKTEFDNIIKTSQDSKNIPIDVNKDIEIETQKIIELLNVLYDKIPHILVKDNEHHNIDALKYLARVIEEEQFTLAFEIIKYMSKYIDDDSQDLLLSLAKLVANIRNDLQLGQQEIFYKNEIITIDHIKEILDVIVSNSNNNKKVIDITTTLLTDIKNQDFQKAFEMLTILASETDEKTHEIIVSLARIIADIRNNLHLSKLENTDKLKNTSKEVEELIEAPLTDEEEKQLQSANIFYMDVAIEDGEKNIPQVIQKIYHKNNPSPNDNRILLHWFYKTAPGNFS